MKDLLTPKQVAKAIGVSEASVKRWCDKAVLPSTRTAGGHRRLPLRGVLEFLRESGRTPVRPQLLALPAVSGEGPRLLRNAAVLMAEALAVGDEEMFRRLVFDLYLAHHSAVAICEQAVTPAFRELGLRWQHGNIEVYQERRGGEIALRTLHELRQALPEAKSGAPLAIGGTLSGDPYVLPNVMVELALREAGWRAESYGNELPAETVAAAIQQTRPRLCWLSVSHVPSATAFGDGCRQIEVAARAAGTVLTIGGRGFTGELRPLAPNSIPSDELGTLVVLARALGAVPPEQLPAFAAPAPHGPSSTTEAADPLAQA